MSVTRLDEWANARAIRIAHDIPGRLRLRLPSVASTEGLEDAIEALNGVQSSVLSPRTRSLLVRYDPGVVASAEIVRAVVEHAEVDPPASHRDGSDDEGRPTVATAVTGVFSGLSERVARRTRGKIDLPMLMSVGLVLWAGRQLLRGPITSLSWTSALWYAHGLFRDYQVPREP